MIKIGFELELDEGVYSPSSIELVQALSEALPKEWWADHREDTWGVKALFALNQDGSLMQSDSRLRPIDMGYQLKFTKAQLDEANKLNAHLDTEVSNLKGQIDNLQEKNGNQFTTIEAYKSEIKQATTQWEASLADWDIVRKQRDVLKDDLKFCQEANRKYQGERALETRVNEEMAEKIVDALQGAGFDTGGWGSDTELEELEIASTQIEDHLQAVQKNLVTLTRFLTDAQDEVGNVSMSVEDASSEQDGLDTLLDHIRTGR